MGYWLNNSSSPATLRLLNKKREAGEAVPTLDNAPELMAAAHLFWRAFEFLSVRRGYHSDGRPKRISLSELAAYCAMTGEFDEDTRADAVHLIAVMDDLWMPRVEKEIARARKRAESKAKAKRRG